MNESSRVPQEQKREDSKWTPERRPSFSFLPRNLQFSIRMALPFCAWRFVRRPRLNKPNHWVSAPRSDHSGEDLKRMETQHFSHHHPLILRLVDLGRIYGINCSACGRSCLDLIHRCRECEDLHLHKSCAELHPPSPQTHTHTNHPFHPFHPLPLVFSGLTNACCGCGQWDSKLLYWCRDCNFTESQLCSQAYHKIWVRWMGKSNNYATFGSHERGWWYVLLT